MQMDFALRGHHKRIAEAHFAKVARNLDRLKDEEPLDTISKNTTNGELLKMAKDLKLSNLFNAKKLLLKLIETSDEPSQLCDCYSECAEVALATGFPSEALDYARKLLSLSTQHEMKYVEYRAYIQWGHACRSTGKNDISLLQYRKAEHIAKMFSLGVDSEKYAYICQQLCVYNQGKNNEALASLLPLLEVHNLSPATKGELKQVLGNIYRSAANWHDAVKCYEESISIATEIKDSIKVAERSGELGNVYRSSGLYAKALELQQLLYDFALSRGDVVTLAATCGYIGFTHYSQGKHDSAIVYLAARYWLAGEIGDISGVRWSLNNIGKTYLELGYLDEALQIFPKSAALARELGDLLGEGTSYGNMGVACRAAGQHQDAVKYHILYRDNAMARMDDGGVAIMQNQLALDYLLIGDLKEARRFAWQALHTNLKIRSHLGLQDDVMKIANHEKNQAISYNILQYILLEDRLPEAAMLVSELGRARVLCDILSASSGTNHTSALVNLAKIMNENGDIQSSLIKMIMKNISDLLQTLRSNLVIYSVIDHPFEQKKKQKWIYIWLLTVSGELHTHKELLGEVNGADFLVDHSSFATLRRGLGVGESSFLQFGQMELSQAVRVRDLIVEDHDNSLTTIGDVASNRILAQLYSKLISPIYDTLCGMGINVPRTIIVPHGFLFNVPFAAIQCPDGRYLIESMIISVAPSIEFLFTSAFKAQNVPRQIDGNKCFVVGNPLMPNKAIFQLPGATEEARLVASHLGCEPCCGEKATKHCVLSHLPESQIIHFATHAILSDSLQDHLAGGHILQDGDYSIKGAVILSCSDEQCSGILTSKEIQAIKLDAELAVLSCCKTACGKVTEDGILGLSRALLIAGVGSIVVTLWSIYDATTTLIMERFYAEYVQSRDAPASLRHAMLAFKETSPACWAAFCVIGISPGICDDVS